MTTEADKLHLVQQVAAEVARQKRIDDPAELWGAGWLAWERIEARWATKKSPMAFARVRIRGAMLDSLGRRKGCLTGNRSTD